MCAYYILYDLFRCDGQNETPFASYLLSAYDTIDISVSKVCIIEKNFLGQLLSTGTKEVLIKIIKFGFYLNIIYSIVSQTNTITCITTRFDTITN